jgi:hypothetical protein
VELKSPFTRIPIIPALKRWGLYLVLNYWTTCVNKSPVWSGVISFTSPILEGGVEYCRSGGEWPLPAQWSNFALFERDRVQNEEATGQLVKYKNWSFVTSYSVSGNTDKKLSKLRKMRTFKFGREYIYHYSKLINKIIFLVNFYNKMTRSHIIHVFNSLVVMKQYCATM